MNTIQKSVLENILSSLNITCQGLLDTLTGKRVPDKVTLSLGNNTFATYELAPEGIVTNIDIAAEDKLTAEQRGVVVALLRNLIHMVICPQYVKADNIVVIDSTDPEVRIRLRDTILLCTLERTNQHSGAVVTCKGGRRDTHYEPARLLYFANDNCGTCKLNGWGGTDANEFRRLVSRLVCANVSVYSEVFD